MSENALASLEAHFRKKKKKEVIHPAITGNMYVSPLNAEDFMAAKRAKDETNPSESSLAICHFLVRKLRREDNSPVFFHAKKNPARILQKSCDPQVVFELFGEVMSGEEETQAEVAELEKKPEPEAKAS